MMDQIPYYVMCFGAGMGTWMLIGDWFE